MIGEPNVAPTAYYIDDASNKTSPSFSVKKQFGNCLTVLYIPLSIRNWLIKKLDGIDCKWRHKKVASVSGAFKEGGIIILDIRTKEYRFIGSNLEIWKQDVELDATKDTIIANCRIQHGGRDKLKNRMFL
jgi:hypothetical protein